MAPKYLCASPGYGTATVPVYNVETPRTLISPLTLHGHASRKLWDLSKDPVNLWDACPCKVRGAIVYGWGANLHFTPVSPSWQSLLDTVQSRNFTRGADRSTEGASVVLVTNKVTMATKK